MKTFSRVTCWMLGCFHWRPSECQQTPCRHLQLWSWRLQTADWQGLWRWTAIGWRGASVDAVYGRRPRAGTRIGTVCHRAVCHCNKKTSPTTLTQLTPRIRRTKSQSLSTPVNSAHTKRTCIAAAHSSSRRSPSQVMKAENRVDTQLYCILLCLQQQHRPMNKTVLLTWGQNI